MVGEFKILGMSQTLLTGHVETLLKTPTLLIYSTRPRCMMRMTGCKVTYEREPDDLACLLLFRARSLSPCVRPFRSSSSSYCKTNNGQYIDNTVHVYTETIQ